MRHLISGCRERISRQTATPLPSDNRNIEHRNIGFGQWNSHPSLDGGAGLAPDLDVTAGLQQILEAATNHVVIVEDEHPGHSPTCPLGSACLRSSRQADAASWG